MKALPTQFDGKQLSNAVATPTCSSCCCCCCCLATSIASSTLLAQRIAKEGEKHQVPNRHLLTVLAALFIPITAALVYFGFWTINLLLKTCTDRVYEFSGSLGSDHYTVCTNPGAVSIIPLLIIVPFLVLLYLYTRVHIEKPLQRAALVMALIVVAFAAELFGGAALIFTGGGGIIYFIMIPVIVGGITVWYHRHLGKEAIGAALPAIHAAYPAEQITDHHEENSTPDKEPPQQNPPTAGSE